MYHLFNSPIFDKDKINVSLVHINKYSIFTSTYAFPSESLTTLASTGHVHATAVGTPNILFARISLSIL